MNVTEVAENGLAVQKNNKETVEWETGTDGGGGTGGVGKIDFCCDKTVATELCGLAGDAYQARVKR